MICNECGKEVEVVGSETLHYESVDKRLIAHIHDIPFYCPTCGSIKFPYRAVNNIVFVWPLLHFVEEAKSDIILIPDDLKYSEYSNYGIVLSFGPGIYNKKKKDKWEPVVGLSVGMKVWYDKTVPWSVEVLGNDKKLYKVLVCGSHDVYAEMEE